MNLGRLLEERAKKFPKGIALLYEGRATDFEELNKTVNRLANGLKGLGIGKGDRVAIMLPNVPEFVTTFFACQKLGSVAVPFNTMYKGGEILHILKDCGAKAIVTLRNIVPLINEIKPDLPNLKYIITTGERDLTFADNESTLFVQGVLSKNIFRDLDDAYQRVGDVLTEGFRGFGLKDVWYKHRGSLRVEGKKLAGFSFFEAGDLYVLQMICFLTPFDPSDFLSVIGIPPEIKDKVLEPLISIEEALGRRPDEGGLRSNLLGVLGKGFGVTFKEGGLTRDEKLVYEKYKAVLKNGAP
ncbi:MAG: AMP-binding protein [Thermodesulfobacteriota bacterium]